MRPTSLLALLLFCSKLHSQDRPLPTAYWVFLTDKDNATFDPVAYFDVHALDRKCRHHLPLYDWFDRPVCRAYVEQLAPLCDSLDGVSRWLNAAVVYASEEQIAQVQRLPFVKSTQRVARLDLSAYLPGGEELSSEDMLMLQLQTERMRGSVFRDSGFTGKGIRIAVFDVGFPVVDEHRAFEHIRARSGIVATYDFSRKSDDVYRGVAHGTAVLSCIAGMYDTVPMGLATDAEFLLARTERLITEWTAEEHRWVFAAEWADKHGADIISSSLGYTAQRYTPSQMDGQTAPITRAANIAASKGILVINSAGNEGDTKWRTVGAPADGDSVLTVGGTDPYTDLAADFTSFGPTADLRIKPNVCAFGEAVTASRQDFGVSFGTSFACPLVAGFAACALQARSDITNMELFQAIERSGHLYPYFDYAHGYGIPLADKFLGVKSTIDTTFRFDRVGDVLSVSLDQGIFPDDLQELYEETVMTGYYTTHHFEMPAGTPQKNLYYHVRDEHGLLIRFGVILPYEKVPLILREGIDFETGQTVTVHYEGFTNSIMME